jgi:peptide deformylase
MVMKTPDLNKLRVIHHPDPLLKKRCTPVKQFGPGIKALAERMFELMREGNGVGLAAPQVGVPIRMFVTNPTGQPGDDLICVNPRFVELDGAEEKEEGCLSFPGVTVTMRRANIAVMEALDADGKPFRRATKDLAARVWQHEVDHLDGRLIADNMSASDEIANRRAIKQLKAEYAASNRRRRKARCASSS